MRRRTSGCAWQRRRSGIAAGRRKSPRRMKPFTVAELLLQSARTPPSTSSCVSLDDVAPDGGVAGGYARSVAKPRSPERKRSVRHGLYERGRGQVRQMADAGKDRVMLVRRHPENLHSQRLPERRNALVRGRIRRLSGRHDAGRACQEIGLSVGNAALFAAGQGVAPDEVPSHRHLGPMAASKAPFTLPTSVITAPSRAAAAHSRQNGVLWRRWSRQQQNRRPWPPRRGRSRPCRWRLSRGRHPVDSLCRAVPLISAKRPFFFAARPTEPPIRPTPIMARTPSANVSLTPNRTTEGITTEC